MSQSLVICKGNYAKITTVKVTIKAANILCLNSFF